MASRQRRQPPWRRPLQPPGQPPGMGGRGGRRTEEGLPLPIEGPFQQPFGIAAPPQGSTRWRKRSEAVDDVRAGSSGLASHRSPVQRDKAQSHRAPWPG